TLVMLYAVPGLRAEDGGVARAEAAAAGELGAAPARRVVA
ncbi:MAG: hypothetical protein JWP53_2026, partial [Conexibacter sp.]|nr:hypothetical protein [Conexibacter sp.]